MIHSHSESIKVRGPRPIPGFVIDRETLDHLPALHKAAAECAIAAGKWRLV